MELAPQVLAGLIGFFGAILGGLIQGIFSTRNARKTFVRESRLSDYRSFVEAVAAMSQAPAASVERQKSVIQMIEAKAKIILSGSDRVIQALEGYSRHAVLASAESKVEFSSLIAAMRADIGEQRQITTQESVSAILLESTKELP